jgi:hypothetical protein
MELPLANVSDLVGACTFNSYRRLLGLPESYGPLTLHISDLENDALDEDLLLTSLTSGHTRNTALIINTISQNTHNYTMHGDQMEIDTIRIPLSFPDRVTNEGVPGIFKTERKKTIRDFYELLYSTTEIQYDLLFFRAPPNSGKTGFAQLLCKKLMENQLRSVVCLTCYDLNAVDKNTEDGKKFESVASLFARVTKYSLEDFIQRTEERVLILDEAQCTYHDGDFWQKIVKSTLGNKLPGLKLVLLSSYGSFNPYRIESGAGTPIAIDEENVFVLHEEYDRPSLSLQFEEFEEMVFETVFEKYKEDIWLLCANHIGVAYTILNYLNRRFRTLFGFERGQILCALYSDEMLENAAGTRGMPTIKSFTTMANTHKANNFDIARMTKIVDAVANGNLLKLDDKGNSPGRKDAAELLVRYGFLFEDEKKYLHFASQMHLKVWLKSSRTDTIDCIDLFSFNEFIVKAIGRMHSARLVGFYKENNLKGVRERQIQMELYSAIVSILPASVSVTPEWQTANKKGYVDLVIRLQNTLWFLELLVDGSNANEHSQRFGINGKYYASLVKDSKYALIDFRQSVEVRDFKDDFLYVHLLPTFAQATIKQSGAENVTISLLN